MDQHDLPYPPPESDPVFASTADLLGGGSLDDLAEPFTLPSGKRVMVRGLSRRELFAAGRDDPDTATHEVRTIVAALVVPKLTRSQAEQWQANTLAGGDLQALSEKIRDLSGLKSGADKSRLAEVRD